MEPGIIQEKPLPARGLKQVKVDNWGSFFLQRLQTLYLEEQFLDLKIKFPTSNITVQAHRLVVTTCTDYFMQLDEQQKEKDENFNGVIIMPSDMPYECVKSIISFMYTGQLEYWTSEQHALYRTAQKMNMTVLTKLLDAQFNTSKMQDDVAKTPSRPVIAVTKPSTPITKTITSSTNSVSNVSGQTLPGRKLPIWKRKLDESPPAPANYEVRTFHSTSSTHKEATPGPSRFDLPEADDIALGVFSSFDDITYNTKPIVQACDTYKKDNSLKGSPDRDSKNDTTEDEDEDNQGSEKNLRDTNSDDDWNISKNYEKSEEGPSKRVRFDLEEKENVEKPKSNHPNTDDSINNHAKIIREVLKKYPHLVKNNKNIRLKIMQKETKSSESNTACKTKISYVVLKSDHLLATNNDENNDSKCNGSIDAETGPWKCNKCDLDEEYTNYYMYRRHMQDVHEEKFDPRVCEHCGYKATKRNILMYHLYTKHNVPPPKSMSFPKCHACSYIALSETLLVRHQINHNHRPAATRHHALPSEDIQCSQCNQSFKNITELTTHELNSGHGGITDGKEKGHRCPYCGKVFVRLTNLQVHLDCAHKELQRDVTESPPSAPPLEPSSEAEALSHVASGIAASLGVGDTETETAAETQEEEETIEIVKTNGDQYIVPDVLNDMEHNISYTTHEIDGQHMIMLVNNDENYQHDENNHHQQPQQLDIADNEQIVMQGTDDGMIVYIHGADEADNRSYETYQPDEVTQETEEIVEEVVEEVEEVVMEEEEVQEEEEMPQHMLEDCGDNQVEEVIQYVEEQTEIVEYDEDQCSEQGNSMDEQQESVMIIEEEHVEGEEDMEETTDKQHKKIQSFTTEWDEDSAGLTES
ncbi:hypothetical protein ALC60_12012 [Trachymyrmex zeteki]|uniref:Centrosome-associated zinc finger protein CP190 n=1 Tax=Mycetomoellerius zeteki TaxID=64791 RepID=A0A151WMC3_9HYME|nr:PREDICTED: centrosome-associated zinc finger protein CP190 [Trachymyrmex zeteki]XP_018312887.1 PREDICTED: centrosome-associated zinc finger protein CP190 [Trachymyrmex zeteki]XP_018312888.1 PREDICTED: centrosome-associated zinc finger protein CP190 [Trachymyrmex zeteki]KYQ48957.1 hypothetical protein ALC60_12012 [Trachymyrmex zeteki]